MDYFDHYHKALELWLKHYDECAIRNGHEHDGQERNWAIDGFNESEQIKILQDGTIKIKWEHRCWWADCTSHVFHGDYYCILAPIDSITWFEPFDLVKRGEEE